MQVVLAHNPPDSIVTDITQSLSHQSSYSVSGREDG
jgi:hypothetical protein